MKLPAALLATVLLSACGSEAGNNAGGSPAGGNQGSASAPAAPVAPGGPVLGGIERQPGLWETSVQFTSIEVPGAPPEVQQQMRTQLGSRAQTSRECVTPEQARDPLARMREMLSRGQGSACTFTDQVFSGGTIRIRGTCPGPQGGSAEISLQGSYTATTLAATMTMNARAPAGAPAPGSGATGMRMTANMTGRRVGECAAGARAGTGR